MTEVTKKEGQQSAPSWDEYLRALSQEGLRYRPASLREALEERARKAGKPCVRDEGQK